MGSFLGISSVNCFAWTNYKRFFAGAFFPALFRRNILSALFRRGFFRALYRKWFYRGFFCGGIVFCSSWGVLYRAVFRSGDIPGLIPLNFFRTFLCRAHFRRSFAVVFSVRFFRVAPVHFSTEPFCVRCLARFFPWAFSQGVPPLQSFALTVSIEFFAGSFSVHYPEGNFLVHFFRGLLRAYFCM